MSKQLSTVAIFGGTFDPIHSGHLSSAMELKQRLSLDELRLMPCHIPPHRQAPKCNSEQRLAMVQLAAMNTGLVVDDREIKRNGPSYSVDTLEELRRELDDDVSLIWVMGTDAFLEFDRWHEWQRFLQLAHIVVIARPGLSLPKKGVIADLLAAHQTIQSSELTQSKAGFIWLEQLTPYPISATAIRENGGNDDALRNFLPVDVLNYIQTHDLYW